MNLIKELEKLKAEIELYGEHPTVLDYRVVVKRIKILIKQLREK